MLLLFSHEVMPNSLWPHGPQHTRLPCPSLSPRVCSNSCPLSQWCHPAISSSVVPVSSCPQSLPASESFPIKSALRMRWLKNWSFSFSISLPMNIQGWFPLGLIGLISLQSNGLSKVFSSTIIWKHQFFSLQPFYGSTVTSVHDYRKNHHLCWQSDVSAFYYVL